MTAKNNLFMCFASIGLANCTFMPSTGPYASNIVSNPDISMKIVDVDEDIARELLRNSIASTELTIQNTIRKLRYNSFEPIVLSKGDVVSLSLWTTGGRDDSVLGNAPQPRAMGNFTVGMNGKIDLPYIDSVYLSGLSLSQAAKVIAKAYGDTSLFPQPEATLQIVKNKKQNVVVMGAVNDAKVINWPDGGLDLGEAIAQAGGFKVFDPSKQGSDLAVNTVVIMRRGEAYDLPIKAGLSNDVPLQSGDRIILQHTPVVRALCIGAGWRTPSIVPFDERPSLSEVLAGAGDLDRNTAQGKAVFVFKRNKNIIYKIDLTSAKGLVSAQYFPIDNRDTVYVAPARLVPLQQIVSTIMSVGYPATMAATMR